jgi:hypothetical protein
MKPVRAVAALRELRSQPLWQLLAADKGVITIALLDHLLLAGEKVLPASVLYERLGRALDELRASGEDLPQTAQGYASDWLSKGWLTRRLAAGAHEEDFEISAEAAAAVRYVTSLLKRRTRSSILTIDYDESSRRLVLPESVTSSGVSSEGADDGSEAVNA